MANPAGRGRFPPEMYGLRPSDYDCQKAGRKEYKRTSESGSEVSPAGVGKLTFRGFYDMIKSRDIQKSGRY